jgi:hypothetical protein
MTENGNNAEAVTILSQSMILLIKIYYDLNCQDLPEFFEDNLGIFTDLFKKYLMYNNPLLATDVSYLKKEGRWKPDGSFFFFFCRTMKKQDLWKRSRRGSAKSSNCTLKSTWKTSLS